MALGILLVLALGGGTTAVLVDRANEQRAAQELAERQAREAREAQELADAVTAYDTAVADLDERITSLGTLATDVETAIATAGEDTGTAVALLDAAAPDVVPAAERTALDTARADLVATLEGWQAPPAPPEIPAERPTTTPEILEATEALEAQTATADTTLSDTQKALDALETQRAGLTGAAEDLLATVPGTSQFYLDTHPVATNASRSTMQLAADGVLASWSTSSSAELATFTAAAQGVATSQTDEEWLLAHPVHPARPEIEAFARSLSGGVPIDISWAPEVNGAGPNGNSGGLATWTTAQYGYSTIQLSDNVAELWPDAGIQALVVHETGHAITSKCYDLYAAPPFNSDDEMFATAWAISMGYDDGNGSGEWLYGRPSDEQIAAAAGCR